MRIVRYVIHIIVSIIQLLLVTRLILKFFAANPKTPFVSWIYNITVPLVAPFASIRPDWKWSGFVIDFAALAAIIVYSIAAYLLLTILSYPHRETDV